MVVSESYLHFELRALRVPPREIGGRVLPLVERAAKDILVEFRGVRRAEVIVEEGSIRLMGLIIVGLELLAKFGEIRSGLDYALHDGKAAAGWINEHVQKALTIPSKDIIAKRRFSPAPTQLLRLFRKVQSGSMSPEEATQRAEELFHHYGESEDTIRPVMERFTREIRSVPQTLDYSPTKRRPVPSPNREAPRSVARPTRRIRFFRDANGRLRIVEEDPTAF